jgi:uncharacterized OsmC-like protein
MEQVQHNVPAHLSHTAGTHEGGKEEGALEQDDPSGEAIMSKVHVTYDGPQHCTAFKDAQGKTVAMDCPYTGKGEEFSPAQMVGAGLVGCMLLSMGVLAMRDDLDISGTVVEVELTETDTPVTRIGAIDVVFTMPRPFAESDRLKLERATAGCPIKHSFHPDIPISVRFSYPA